MLWSRRADADTLERLLAAARVQELSYPEVGASLGKLPAGYDRISEARPVGRGSEDFARARDGIGQWAAHRGARIRVHPVDAPIERDTTVALALPAAGFSILAACRIVAVIDESARYGFAYGTLASHPESGEEAFVVTRDDDGDVTFRITAFSRPADPVTRLLGPVARRLQRETTGRYLDGLARSVAAAR